MDGQRAADDKDWFDFEVGEYRPVYAEDGQIKALLFKDPTGELGRIAAEGHGNKVNESEWKITENEAGVVTVDPSIDGGEGRYHGHLREGVWT